MSRKILFILKICVLALLAGGGFLSCEILNNPSSDKTSNEDTQNPDSDKDSDTDDKDDSDGGSSGGQTASQKSLWTGSEELTWQTNVSIPAETFSDAADGSLLILSVSEIASADYHNIKLHDGKWNYFSSQNVSGASSNDGTYTPTSDTITYTLTNSEVSSLKKNGLSIHGYGVTLSKVVLETNGGSGGNEGDDKEEPPNPPPVSQTGTPFANHGKLHVTGAYLCDEHNKKYQLYGMSTHGINFGEGQKFYVNKEAFKTLRDDWNTNCIRLVLYPKDYNGYCNGGNQAELKKIVCDGIEYAAELGMYVLVDWHVHNYNPQDTQSEAIAFLGEISSKYANYGNVLYEICNEPTGSPWSSAIKPYAQAVIPAIRANAPDAVIIVGTNTWSQDLDEAWADKLDFANVMYTFHFYANSHTSSMRTRVENAINKGMPVFITEFGTCDASGNGGFNKAESESWFNLMQKYSISHLNWSLCNKNETASAISAGCSKTSGWTESDLTESGKLVRTHFRTLSR